MPITHTITPDDPSYPARLRDLKPTAGALYLQGTLRSGDQPAVAIVGTRGARHGSTRLARQLAADLARARVTVVSGGALGVDAAAHEGALEASGYTIAVLGSGFDLLYPERNCGLFRRIAERGALVTPFPLGTPPYRRNFPIRNRLVAALAEVVVVVEAPGRSGALNTARHARKLNVPVLATHSGAGARRLLRQGAGLVSEADDILRVLEGTPPKERRQPPSDPDERSVLTLVTSTSDLAVDDAAQQLGWSVARAAAALMRLEIAGWVRTAAAGRFSRC